MGDESCTEVVCLQTTEGDIYVELYSLDAPLATQNFRNLCHQGYYDGTVIHRVAKGSFLQAGDPTGTGLGGVSSFGYLFPDEISPRLFHSGAGIVGMASAGPNLNGSQFYITLGPCPQLDQRCTIFGRVSSGMHVVKRIADLALKDGASDGRPLTDVWIKKTFLGSKQRQRRPTAAAPVPAAGDLLPPVSETSLEKWSKENRPALKKLTFAYYGR